MIGSLLAGTGKVGKPNCIRDGSLRYTEVWVVGAMAAGVRSLFQDDVKNIPPVWKGQVPQGPLAAQCILVGGLGRNGILWNGLVDELRKMVNLYG